MLSGLGSDWLGKEPAVRKESLFGSAAGLAVLAALLGALAAPAASAVTTYQSAVVGTVAPSSGVALGPQFALPTRARGTRRAPRSLAAAAPTIAVPQAPASALGGAGTSLPVNFDGVSSRDSALTNFGHEFEPPDQGLCVGNGFVLEMVNSAYKVYDTTGKLLAGPFNVNGPFDEGLSEFTSDPRCHFDAATHTWFATILAINASETASTLDLAVNPSGDPTKPWTVYKLDTTGLGGRTGPKHPGCPCFGDQPTLGIDAENVYVTTNEFSILGPQFNGAQIYAFAKKDLVSLSSTVHFVHFDKLSIGGTLANSVQPALTTGSPSAEFFLGALDPNETFDQRIGVWAMTERGVVASGGTPKLSSTVVNAESYGVPPKAEQKGSSSLIEPDEDRMQQTQFSGGGIWGELDTALTIANDPVQRAGAAWFEVKPQLGKGVLTGAHVQRQGYVAVRGNYLLYPALQVGSSGAAAMVMTLTGATHFPSAAYAVLAPGATEFGPVNVAAAGHTNYDPNATRWGDYSWAVQDPGGASVWLATEYVPPKSSQTSDGVRNWGTRVFEVPTG
jgi:hypothetical protein